MKRMLLMLLCAALLTGMAAPAQAEVVVAFEKASYTLLAGKSAVIKPVVQGTKAQAKLAFSSDDPAVATVKSNGAVKAMKAGNTTIRCRAAIGKSTYDCAYALQVRQPVSGIRISISKVTLPPFCEMPFPAVTVTPADATDPSLSFSTSDARIAMAGADGVIRTLNKAGTATLTCRANDGSGVKATLKVTVPKTAWLSSKKIVIDDPAGAILYYAPTLNQSFQTIRVSASGGVVDVDVGVAYSPQEKEQMMADYARAQGFSLSLGHQMGFRVLEPLKAGKGKVTVSVNGSKVSAEVEVKRSAVYESCAYKQFEKNAKKLAGQRFSVTGVVAGMEMDGPGGAAYSLWMNGDELQPVLIQVPKDLSVSADLTGQKITVKGIFQEMVPYTTETGLKKSRPLLLAERMAP